MTKRAKRPDGASSIYFGTDGYWHGRVTVGVCDDGKPDRRHVSSKTSEAEVIKKVRALEKQRDEEGSGNLAGRGPLRRGSCTGSRRSPSRQSGRTPTPGTR